MFIDASPGRSLLMSWLILVCLLSTQLACGSGSQGTPPGASPQRVATEAKSGAGVVVAGHPDAVEIGRAVLARGGTAADAAVAVSLALGVAEPYGSGMGGKLALLYFDAAASEVYGIEALDQASGGFTPEYVASLSDEQLTAGWTAVAVPGLVAGLQLLHERSGELAWSDLVLPVSVLADEGALVLPRTREFFDRRQERIRTTEETAALFLPEGGLPEAGSRLANPQLAETLRTVAREGAAGFYEGPIAEAIAAASLGARGSLTAEDLAGYEARFTSPLEVEFAGQRVFSSSPPTSGGSTLLLALDKLDEVAWEGTSMADAENLNRVGRVLQQVYPVVQGVVADDPASRTKVVEALSEEVDAVAALGPEYLPGNANHPEAIAADGATTHFVVVDSRNNMASVTQSLSHHFGAGVVAPGTGVLMNNSLRNFSYSNLGSVNAPGEGKRPRSTIAPTIVLTEEGAGSMALGVPGGQRIPTATLQVLIDTLVFSRPLEEALAAPRVHLRRDGAGTDAREFEFEYPQHQTMEDLRQLGWDVRWNQDTETFGGFCAAIRLGDGLVQGVADLRRTNAVGVVP